MTTDFSDVDLSDVDLTDLRFFEDGPPHALFARMRSQPGPHRNAESASGAYSFWSFTKLADIQTISKDSATFSSARGGVFSSTEGAVPIDVLRETILGMDPPRHTTLRNVVQSVFTGKLIRQKEADIRSTVTALIDDVIERGTCDFVTDIAVELPLRVIADMLGTPQDERAQLFEWTNRLSLAAATADPEMGLGALMEIGGYLTALVADRRAHPRQDLISQLITADVDGDRMSEADVTTFFALLDVRRQRHHPKHRVWGGARAD